MATAALRWLLPPILAAALGCDASSGAPKPPVNRAATPAPSGPRFLKGQVHAHTDRSLDSDTPPEEAAAWYAAHGYDFVIFTDHNRITEIPAPGNLLLIPGVELTQNLAACDPPPEPGLHCLLHVNALFVTPNAGGASAPRQAERTPGTPLSWGPLASLRRVDLYGRAVDRAIALGGVAQLNHPNFHYGADVDVIVALSKRGLSLMEIANQAVDSANEGDARHPSTEALWDEALRRGARVYGTASDDAHNYSDADRVRARGEIAYVGDRGFIMVRADKTAASIKKAIAAGDFYSSTGARFDRLDLGPSGIAVDVQAGEGTPRIEVIADGAVVEDVRGQTLRFDPRRASPRYVRVRVTFASGQKAWTQPVWLAPSP
jgi:hypothetical protein